MKNKEHNRSVNDEMGQNKSLAVHWTFPEWFNFVRLSETLSDIT